MKTPDPLQCTFDDARRTTLIQGIALDTRAKIAYFEEMVSMAVKFGARERLAGVRTTPGMQPQRLRRSHHHAYRRAKSRRRLS